MDVQDKKLLFIFNPNAGKGKIRGNVSGILDIMTKAGYEVTAYPTQKKGDGHDRVFRKGHCYDLIVCAGGDGTMDEVVSGVIESGCAVPIGYIPTGSTNDFASSLQIPKDILRSAQIAVSGRRFVCDIGVFQNRHFVYVAAFGAFTEVSYGTSQGMKNNLGHFAYILSSVPALAQIKAYEINISVDDELFDGEFIYGMVTNSESVGGVKGITGRQIDLQDGLFEVTLVRRPKNPSELASIVTSLLAGETSTEKLIFRKASHVVFHFHQETSWTLDGEYGGTYKTVEITNAHGAVEIMVPTKPLPESEEEIEA